MVREIERVGGSLCQFIDYGIPQRNVWSLEVGDKRGPLFALGVYFFLTVFVFSPEL